MKRRSLSKIFLPLIFLLILLSTNSALAGANIVPITRVDEYGDSIVPNDLKPAECSSITVDEITAGSGTINGTNSNNLILGSNLSDIINASNAGSKWLTNCILGGSGDDTINGSKKAEIILGGPGNDILRGRRGDDILYGGPGDDIIRGGMGYDICYGGGGNDTFIDCEETY
jgi:Ca2+-binding RTX toxin-like protein